VVGVKNCRVCGMAANGLCKRPLIVVCNASGGRIENDAVSPLPWIKTEAKACMYVLCNGRERVTAACGVSPRRMYVCMHYTVRKCVPAEATSLTDTAIGPAW